MSYFLLESQLVDDYLERRPAFREEHLTLADAAHGRGELVLAGALADPTDRAVLLFRSADAAEAFARRDPYGRTASFATGPCGSGRSSSAATD